MPNNQHTRPLWFAALLTPLVAPAAYILSMLGLALPTVMEGQRTSPPLIQVLAFMFALVLLASSLATCIFVLPSALWLRARIQLTRGRLYIVAGIAGFTTTAVYLPAVLAVMLKSWPQVGWFVYTTAFAVLFGIPLGLLSGYFFCLAAGITIRSSGPRSAAA